MSVKLFLLTYKKPSHNFSARISPQLIFGRPAALPKQPGFYLRKVNDVNVEAANGGSHSLFFCFAQHGLGLNISFELS